MRSKNLLEPTNLHYLASAFIKGEKRVFLCSVCAKSKLTESGSEYNSPPELPCGGQTEDTVPTAGAVPLALQLWPSRSYFQSQRGQGNRSYLQCVCAPFYNVFLTVTNGTWLGSVYSEPIPGEFHRFVL